MSFEDDFKTEQTEVGSDELLSDDNLRLPVDANPLVKLHAVRAWLSRRQRDTKITMGEAALQMHDLQQAETQGRVLRRREREVISAQLEVLQHAFQQGQQRLDAYVEAAELLEDCVNHTTVGEHLLVEYYLSLGNVLQDMQEQASASPRFAALTDVLQRIEHVSLPSDDD